jgi:integrase
MKGDTASDDAFEPAEDAQTNGLGARATGISTELGCHSFRATGITVYLQNGGLLEHAQQMAAHESARTTKLYDRRNDKVTLDEVEKIML